MTNKQDYRILIENLCIIKDIFDAYGVIFWLDWGTLLGAIREGKIIEWDTDLDIGVFADDFKKIYPAFSREIKKANFSPNIPLIPSLMPSLHLHRRGHILGMHIYSKLDENSLIENSFGLPRHGLKKYTARILNFLWRALFFGREVETINSNIKFILFLLIRYTILLLPDDLKQNLQLHIERNMENKYFILREIIVPNFYFNKFRPIKFYDMEVLIPDDAPGYLEYKYGKDWEVPNKKWSWKERFADF